MSRDISINKQNGNHAMSAVGSASDRAISKLSIASWLNEVEKSTFTNSDGITLNVYTAGTPGRHAAVLINPIGVSSLLLAPLMQHLSHNHFVINWETRGLPSLNSDRKDMSLAVEDHIEDIYSILKYFHVDSVDIISYCSGTSIALSLLSKPKTSVCKAVFISPSVLIDEDIEQTNHQRTVIPIWEGVTSKGIDYCGIISNLMAAGNPQWGDVDSELDYVNRLPFIDGLSTYLYAKLLASANKIKYSAIFNELETPVMLIHANDDELIHVSLSHYIHNRLNKSKLHIVDKGGHFAICKDKELYPSIEFYLTESTNSE